MLVHEFGEKGKPIILLLAGTCCYWRGNFSKVIDELQKDFFVAAASNTGFDENDTDDFTTVTDEVVKLENYIKRHYDGRICAAYGCSLGGSLVGLLTARNNIHMQYGILGSSDLDQAGSVKASLMSALIGAVIYPYIHTGKYSLKLFQKKMDRRMADPDPYNRGFVSMVGRDKYDMSFISKTSIKNQFKSDLVTPLPEQIDNGETEIHIFYALQMGEKYRERYMKHFNNPVIHEHNMRHEEFFGLHSDEWCELVRQICLK